jgi:hypothetical protein
LRPDNDLAIGHIITLLQFDWPLEEELMIHLMERIRQQGSFTYSLFQNYIVNVDVLEEFMYLSTEQGGGITLDIMPSAQLTRYLKKTQCIQNKLTQENINMLNKLVKIYNRSFKVHMIYKYCIYIELILFNTF